MSTSKFFTADHRPNGVVVVSKTVDGEWAGSVILHPDADRMAANVFEIDLLKRQGFLAKTPVDRAVLNEARRKFSVGVYD